MPTITRSSINLGVIGSRSRRAISSALAAAGDGVVAVRNAARFATSVDMNSLPGLLAAERRHAPPLGRNAANGFHRHDRSLASFARSDNRLRNEPGRAQRVRDLDVGGGLKGQQGGANRCMLEDSPRHETMLERNGSFHVRSAVINAAGHREQPVVDGSCPRVVFGFAGRNELDERLRRKTAIPHQSPVDVEHGVQQIFVMAGKNLQIGTLATDAGISVSHLRMLATPFFMAKAARCVAISSWVLRLYVALVASGYWKRISGMPLSS